jgi:hypothetical protein
VLIAITPNTASCIHRRFGADWLGLDPPRHLHLFNRGTLQRIAEQASVRLRVASYRSRGIERAG